MGNTATAATSAVLAAMVARDLGDDLTRAVTFPGSYRPTVGVMLQRHWGAHLSSEALTAIAASIRPDVWVEAQIGYSYVGFRDNRDRDSHAADLERLALEMRKRGLRVQVSRGGGLANNLRVQTSKASDAAVEAAAPLYIERINRAMQASQVSL